MAGNFPTNAIVFDPRKVKQRQNRHISRLKFALEQLPVFTQESEHVASISIMHVNQDV